MSSHSKDQLAVTQAFNKRIQNHKQNTLLFLASISCSPLIEFFSCRIITFQKFQWNSQFCQFDCKSIYSVRLFSAQYVLTLPQNFHIYFFPHPVRYSVLSRAKEWEINRAVMKERELGISQATMNAAPGYFHRKNRRKIEPKEIPGCLIPRVLVVFT